MRHVVISRIAGWTLFFALLIVCAPSSTAQAACTESYALDGVPVYLEKCSWTPTVQNSARAALDLFKREESICLTGTKPYVAQSRDHWIVSCAEKKPPEPEGRFVETCGGKNTLALAGYFFRGRRDGIWHEYSCQTGNLSSISLMRDGKREGSHILLDDQGNVRQVDHYIEGKPARVWPVR